MKHHHSALWVLLLLLGLIASPMAREQRLWNPDLQRGLAEGRLFPSTISPNGKFAFFLIYPYYDGDHATSISKIVIGSTDQQTLYGILESRTDARNIDVFIETILQYRWSPDSRYVAVHNPVAKHSELTLYDMRQQLDDTADIRAHHLALPDLRAFAQQQLLMPSEDVVSSGQDPIAWQDARTLQITVRLNTHNGTKSTDIRIRINESNQVEILEKSL